MKSSGKKFGVSIAVAGALLMAASVVFSQGPPRGGRGGQGRATDWARSDEISI